MVAFVALWPLIVPTPWPVIGLFMLHQIFRNTMLHAGYELWPARANGKPWFDWITTTTTTTCTTPRPATTSRPGHLVGTAGWHRASAVPRRYAEPRAAVPALRGRSRGGR
jgi:hypothetical protein